MVKYFHFQTDDDRVNFHQKLESFQCTHIINNGQQCRKRCQIGLKMCWIHLLSEKHLRIKDSNISGAGKGSNCCIR